MKELAEAISANGERLAQRIMALHFERNPELRQHYDERLRGIYLRDTAYNLEALSAALVLETPETFSDYVAWLHRLLTERSVGTAGLPLHFECMVDALREVLPKDGWTHARDYIQAGTEVLMQKEAAGQG